METGQKWDNRLFQNPPEPIAVAATSWQRTQQFPRQFSSFLQVIATPPDMTNVFDFAGSNSLDCREHFGNERREVWHSSRKHQ